MHLFVRRKRVPAAPRQRGFTLIEVLVSTLILLVGLLGVVSMQMLSLQVNQGAYFRSQALSIASEILDAMRANPSATASYVGIYPTASGSSTVPGAQACATDLGGCSPVETAAADVRMWSAHFADLAPDPNSPAAFKPALPGGEAVITQNGNEVTVTVTWNERVFEGGAAAETEGESVIVTQGPVARVVDEQSVSLTAVIVP